MKTTWEWIRTHPFTTAGGLSLAFFFLIGAEVLPMKHPWHALMLPSYLLQAVVGVVVFTVLPFAEGPALLAKLIYFLALLPCYFAILLGADQLLVWGVRSGTHRRADTPPAPNA